MALFAVSVPTRARDAYPGTCPYFAYATGLAAADTQLVALVSTATPESTLGQQIYVCDWSISSSATATAYLETSTSASACTNNKTQITAVWYLGANTNAKIAGNSFWRGIQTAPGLALCVHTTGAGSTDVAIYYDQK